MRAYHCFAYAGVSLFTVATSSAFAQAVPPQATPDAVDVQDDTGELAPTNEIVVSARRREESVQDVPQTVNVVTAAQVEKLNLRNFTEIQAVVPGLTMTTATAFSNQATVRGVAFSPEASGNNPAVEFYLNDAPISSAFLFQTTFDFGQFELQRGPQGTLRGRASPSGSIAVTTRRPDLDEVGAVVSATTTDLQARKIDGAVNIPVVQDMLAVRVAGAIDKNRGNSVRTTKEGAAFGTNEDSFRRTEAIRASVRFEPAEWAQVNLMYQSLHNDTHRLAQVASNSLFVSGAPQTTLLIRPFDRLSIEDQGTYDRQDQDVIVGNADLRFAGQRLSYVGSYNEQKFGVLAAQDPTDFYGNLNRVRLAPRTVADPDQRFFAPVCATEIQHFGVNTTTGAFFQCTRTAAQRESHEVRLVSEDRLAGVFDYVVGALYDDTKTRNQITQETPLPSLLPAAQGGGINPVIGAPALTPIRTDNLSTEKSVFGNITAHLLDDRLELSGGLRHISYKSTQSVTTFSNSLTAPAPVIANRQAFPLPGQPRKLSATVYLASAKYEITPDIMVYALTASSWRPPAVRPGNFSCDRVRADAA
jgi:iron complex outermembrane recepter protein